MSTVTLEANSKNAAVGWKCLAGCVCIILAVEAIAAWSVGIDRPLRADEPHFVETIIQFGTSPLSLDLLTHYNEMSGPVPFVLYGAWGRAFGFEPQILRLFSVVVAVCTYLLLFWFLQSETGHLRLSALGTAFVALHPYMLYLSLFVYTDMLAILCLIGAIAAVRRERPLWLAVALCGAVLNRQYLAFATAAAGAYFLARYILFRQRRDLLQLLAVGASLVPLAGLCLLWRGLCPDGTLKHIYLDKHPSYHVSSLILYVSLMSIYLSPVLVARWREFFGCKKSLVFAAALCWLYWCFPVTASPIAAESGFRVGMLHLTLHRTFNSEALEQLVFFCGFVGGLAIVRALALDAWHRWRAKCIDFQFFLDLTAFAFLAVMPCSYLHWEKYFMPLVPVLLLRILFVPFREMPASADEAQDAASLPVMQQLQRQAPLTKRVA